MVINQNWDINDLIKNIKRLKKEYIFYLAFFLSDYTYEELKIRNILIKDIKDRIYSLNIDKKQIDKCWEYMNDDINYPDFVYFSKKIDKRRKK